MAFAPTTNASSTLHSTLHKQSLPSSLQQSYLLLAFDVPEHKILPLKFASAKDSPYIRSPQNNKDWTSNKRFNHNPFAKMSKLIVFFLQLSNSTKQLFSSAQAFDFEAWVCCVGEESAKAIYYWELTMLFFHCTFFANTKRIKRIIMVWESSWYSLREPLIVHYALNGLKWEVDSL